MKDILVTQGLAIGYKRKVLARGLNLHLGEGVTALIGRNGAGKSTLIKTLTGNLKPLEGEICLNGRPLESYSRKRLAREVSLVSTDSHNAGGLRLHELVALGRIPFSGTMGRLSEEDREKVEGALQALGLAHKRDSFVAELSDGERQKGMVARGLVQETPIIIMDEPFSFLDVAARLEMLAMTVELAESRKKAVLFSTHEVSEALRTVENIWMFTVDGEIMEGTPDRLIANGDVDRLFMGDKIKFDRNIKEFYLK